jgi:hypothetical protein
MRCGVVQSSQRPACGIFMMKPRRAGGTHLEAFMSTFSRSLFRLRQLALRWYEIGLCAALLAMAGAVAFPSSAVQREEADVQCGKIQSSTVVMQR